MRSVLKWLEHQLFGTQQCRESDLFRGRCELSRGHTTMHRVTKVEEKIILGEIYRPMHIHQWGTGPQNGKFVTSWSADSVPK